jgi:hypothetical protein
MSDKTIILLALAIIALSAASSWFSMRVVERRYSHRRRSVNIFIAGVIPLLVAVILLVAWDIVLQVRYPVEGSNGNMSPLILLIYGYPYFALMLLGCFATASRVKRAQ